METKVWNLFILTHWWQVTDHHCSPPQVRKLDDSPSKFRSHGRYRQQDRPTFSTRSSLISFQTIEPFHTIHENTLGMLNKRNLTLNQLSVVMLSLWQLLVRLQECFSTSCSLDLLVSVKRGPLYLRPGFSSVLSRQSFVGMYWGAFPKP